MYLAFKPLEVISVIIVGYSLAACNILIVPSGCVLLDILYDHVKVDSPTCSFLVGARVASLWAARSLVSLLLSPAGS